MFYKLNQILFVALLAGSAIYGLVVFIKAPPVLRQKGQGENSFQKQVRKDFEKTLKKIQDQQAEAFQRSMDQGRSATGS